MQPFLNLDIENNDENKTFTTKTFEVVRMYLISNNILPNVFTVLYFQNSWKLFMVAYSNIFKDIYWIDFYVKIVLGQKLKKSTYPALRIIFF